MIWKETAQTLRLWNCNKNDPVDPRTKKAKAKAKAKARTQNCLLEQASHVPLRRPLVLALTKPNPEVSKSRLDELRAIPQSRTIT
jgi:hypothetical protein